MPRAPDAQSATDEFLCPALMPEVKGPEDDRTAGEGQ